MSSAPAATARAAAVANSLGVTGRTGHVSRVRAPFRQTWSMDATTPVPNSHAPRFAYAVAPIAGSSVRDRAPDISASVG